MTEKNSNQFSGISPFKMDISYVEIDSVSPLNINDAHIHEECEIYINLSGDVSFVVENTVYPINPGDIIITRPGEFHHCIYRSNAMHRHFWILISCRDNEELLDMFFNRALGHGNLLTPTSDNSLRINLLCNALLSPDSSQFEKYKQLFDLLSILRITADNEKEKELSVSDSLLPSDIAFVLEYLNDNFSAEITVSDLAAMAHVSINTLERHFRETLNSTPTEYIKKKRLARSQQLLKQGFSVQEACENSGFSDYSHYIAAFKRAFGMTPLKYKKQFSRQG